MGQQKSLRSDRRGAALAEFGLIIPVLLILLMGAFDAGHRLYARSVLQGAVQKAARDAGLENGTAASRQASIDAGVRSQLLNIHKDAAVTIDRRAYRDFANAAAPAETFTDTDNDGVCDGGEPFEDINRNGTRDLDIGILGQGGAEDAVVYTVRMRYTSVTPVSAIVGINNQVDMTAQTVLRNQPYNDQSPALSPLVGNCP
ncbi:MAG TPA: TadE/TadG family type IV pilus assembly protein [Sphingomonadaceae bacterium]|nr:TadE/TadG family type IV pilus assembly protein [Sphingomonadaceae bacterium]